MKKLIYILVLSVFAINTLHAQEKVTYAGGRENDPIYPFQHDDIDVRYKILIDLEDSLVKANFLPVFQKYEVPFTPDAWQEFFTQVLDQMDPQLAKYIDYRDGEDVLHIGTHDAVSHDDEFIKDMRQVLLIKPVLENYLKHLDKTRLD